MSGKPWLEGPRCIAAVGGALCGGPVMPWPAPDGEPMRLSCLKCSATRVAFSWETEAVEGLVAAWNEHRVAIIQDQLRQAPLGQVRSVGGLHHRAAAGMTAGWVRVINPDMPEASVRGGMMMPFSEWMRLPLVKKGRGR